MSLINSGHSADKQILTDCYLRDILERLQRSVFIKGNRKDTLLRLTFVIAPIPAMDKHVTRVLNCKVRGDTPDC